jgi:nucleoside phosphorylase
LQEEPRVFLGPIASANTLLKDPARRDSLRDQFGVKAVEMEGAGIADATWTHGIGYLVVRGICDHADANKNDAWQNYSAMAAAAYVRALLESMP